ncbi:MAG: ACT domain-containing protein [Candidatus Aramenus sp.]|nr:ACT domain-containing protein [Candidatus Aramenus sp.]
MTQEKVLRVTVYYRDSSILEKVISTFRKLWVDIDWMNVRKTSDDGLYEIYMGVRDNKNTYIAILNLSKTVDVEKVEVLENARLVEYKFNEKGEVVKEGKYTMAVYVPVFSKVTSYSWGEVVGENIH